MRMTTLHNELLPGTLVDVSGTEIASRNDALWGEIGVGGSINWDDDKYSIYGQVFASSSLDGLGESYKLNGKAGFRVRW